MGWFCDQDPDASQTLSSVPTRVYPWEHWKLQIDPTLPSWVQVMVPWRNTGSGGQEVSVGSVGIMRKKIKKCYDSIQFNSIYSIKPDIAIMNKHVANWVWDPKEAMLVSGAHEMNGISL